VHKQDETILLRRRIPKILEAAPGTPTAYSGLLSSLVRSKLVLMKFVLIWSREVESRALVILGPSLTRKNAKTRAFPICYHVYVITTTSSRRGIIAIVVEYARRRPMQETSMLCSVWIIYV
jgi:hypothetical protein